jgi:hypothetical protein
MRYGVSWILASALWLPAPALAADAAAPLAAEHRLSEDEKKRILDTAAAKRNTPQPIEEKSDGERPRPQIHGEVGFGIGTGGYRSAFGTAVVPLGNEGLAIISFDNTNFGSRNFPYDYGYER